MTLTVAGTIDGEVVAEALGSAWDGQSPKLAERLDVVERLLVAALEDEADADLHRDGTRAALELAGSLDAFGFAAASALAARVAQTLEAVPALGHEVLRLSELVVALRGQLDVGPPDPPSDTAPMPVAGSSAAVEASPSEAPVVLLVGRDPELLDRLAAAADVAGLRTVSAASGEQGLALLGEERAAAVLLDLLGSEGQDPLAFLDRLPWPGGRVPALALSDSAEAAERVAAVRRGVVGFLDRALPAPQLLDVVRDHVDPLRDQDWSVLVVGHHPAVLATVAAALEPGGIGVATMADPRRVFDVLVEGPVDLVVLDADLPGMTGSELCRALRSDPRWATLPVVLLLGDDGATTVEEALRAGADDWVRTTADSADLLATVADRLRRVRLVRRTAETDAMTGLWNRRRSLEMLEDRVADARRTGEALSLAVIDVDQFRRVNHRLGYHGGNDVLRRFGALLQQVFGADDVIARWGGEEFVVGMSGTSHADAVARVTQLQTAVRDQHVLDADGQALSVTVSAGLARYPDDGDDLIGLYRSADEALYQAKSEGPDSLAVPRAHPTPDTGSSVDVLVVEDDELLAELIVHGLDMRGFTTRWLRDGQEALEALRDSLAARVVLLDRDLPGLSGPAVLRELGEAGLLRTTRVIMLAGQASEEEVLESFESGAVDHVTKPISVPVLVMRARQALQA